MSGRSSAREGRDPLEDAVLDLFDAVDSRGLRIRLVNEPFDIEQVRKATLEVARIFTEKHVFFDTDESCYSVELTAARHLSLLTNLLVEHLRKQQAPLG